MKCPNKKASTKEPSVAATGEFLAAQFELDFTLIACMTSNVTGHMFYQWCHTPWIGNRDIFSELEEK